MRDSNISRPACRVCQRAGTVAACSERWNGQRVRQLTTDNRTLEERLPARCNNRFADRRIAQLEAELASPPGAQGAT